MGLDGFGFKFNFLSREMDCYRWISLDIKLNATSKLSTRRKSRADLGFLLGHVQRPERANPEISYRAVQMQYHKGGIRGPFLPDCQ